MGLNRTKLVLAAIAAGAAMTVGAAPGSLSFSAQAQPTEPGSPLPSLRQRADIIDKLLADRLDRLIPQLMREEGVQMWLLMSREYFEDPVTASMLDAKSMSARRRTILVFYDPGDGQPIERLTVSRYGLAGLFDPSWNPAEEPDQWKAVGDIIAARDPENIAINVSRMTRFADGMTHSQFGEFMQGLPAQYRERVISGETLSTRWLETRTEMEMAIYPEIAALAHSIIDEARSNAVITPGKTTCADVQWWYREK
ncbi:MAG: Xaa-Pro aminopeptidase, partial [Erythrobacter sp.]|nr:Xaa-Pro aminopeptidase [Erythrobacter sp.]